MSNYTPEEIQTAVEKIVRSTVRNPTGILGERKIETAFSDIQEAASGVYILYFNAPFYTLYLGAKRLQDQVELEAKTIASLIEAIYDLNRLVSPVKDLTPLANAQAALNELEQAVVSRDKSFEDIEKVPAFRRYVQNLEGFLEGNRNSVVGSSSDPSASSSSSGSSGSSSLSIQDTPRAARLKIPALIRDLKAQHEETIRRAKLLARGMEDFSGLKLPQVTAQGVISRARNVLEAIYGRLVALPDEQRTELLREVVLDLLTQKPIVKAYGAATGPSEYIRTTGMAAAWSDATHLAKPAALQANLYGPYPITEANQMVRFTMDGGAPFDFPLPLGFVATLSGVATEPFIITNDNNQFQVDFGAVDSFSTYGVALTVGSRTSQQIVDEVMGQLGGNGLVLERYFLPVKLDSLMTITPLGGSNTVFGMLAGTFTEFGFKVGDQIDVLDGPNAGTTWTIDNLGSTGTSLLASGTTIAVASGPAGARVRVGPAARALRWRDEVPVASLALRRLIRLPQAGGEADLAAAVLGFFPGAQARSRPVTAKDLATYFQTSTSRLTASVGFAPLHYAGTARSEPSNAAKVVLSVFQGAGTITAGTTVTFTATSGLGEDELFDEIVAEGDKLVLRSSSNPADAGKEGSITVLDPTTLTVAFPTPISAGDVVVEVGPDVTFSFGAILNITSGPNKGRYMVSEDQGFGGDVSFEVRVETPLPVPKSGTEPLEFIVEFGLERIAFESRQEQVTSAVTVDNTPSSFGAQYFFPGSQLPASARGTTPYLLFEDDLPRTVAVGDLVLLFEGAYSEASREFSIVGLESGPSVVELAPPIESTASFSFDFDVPTPFGRIRVAQVANYGDFEARLDDWLKDAFQQPAFFAELTRYVSPILVNQNPGLAAVNDAAILLKELLSQLTIEGANIYGSPGEEANTLEYALANYVAPPCEPVDTLLGTLRQKGADRAIDLLVEGQFSVFFGLNSDGVSYSGELLRSLRELAREDLPVRKYDRPEAFGEKLIGVVSGDKDYEYDVSDADSPNVPEAPAAPDVPTPGENY